MKHKFFYRLTIIILTVCLITQTIDRPMKKVEAAAFAIPLVWEILQYILLGAGVTYFGYVALDNLGELIDRLTEPDTLTEEELAEIERLYYEQIASLNAAETGLGDALNNAISAASIANGAYTITIPQAAWEKLKGLAERVAREPIIENRPHIEYRKTFAIESSQAGVTNMFKTAAEAIPESILPYNAKHVRVRVLYPQYPSTGSYWRTFLNTLENIRSEHGAAYVSAIYISQEDEVSKEGAYFIAFIITSLPADRIERNSAGQICVYNGDESIEYISSIAYFANTVWGYGHFSDTSYSTRSLDLWNNYWLNNFFLGNSYFTFPVQVNTLFLNQSLVTIFPADVLDIFKTTLRTGTYDVVTPGRSLSDTGTLEGDITITIPTTFPIADELGKVLSDEFPATDVLPKIGVTPVDIADDKVIGKDMTITDAIEDAKTESPAIPAPAPGASEFDLGLASFFPFCIPFDFANFVKVLKAEPEAPSFKFKFVVGKNSKGFIYEEYTISLEQFDTVAYWCRKFELLAFIIGLMLVTRSKFIRS